MLSRAMIGAVAAAVGLAGCGSDELRPPTGPSGPPSVFTADLVPADPDAGSRAAGRATVTVTTQRDANGTITAASVGFTAAMTGLATTTTGVTTAQILLRNAFKPIPVVTVTDLSPALRHIFDRNDSFNIMSFDVSGVAIPPLLASQILDEPASYYFSVETETDRDGALRGILR